MEQYKIRILKKAREDMEEVVTYLNQFYTETALEYFDYIVQEIERLQTMPERCPLVRDTVLRQKGYRYLIIRNYVLFFIIKGNVVQIRRVLYNRRQYNNLL
ncbi:type II toxin-antitoxin system RelE/ParE family toxin [Anaeromicropila herbilytica]|uniref:Type II toxin-antitoxin system RelE/ParE family toxin n=1 Tax=Anaeromicropila herbilytica TaxID=2785025 RepID=A0A7R7IDN2_9FIRM|nr:type II toxin-antitoxin system RelE/ParE family toxin [Anaeromicropila herbilytica]BCN31893.1 hypothetical protein bsdtb5_31880 [Anaeromicropila herbilytica]